MTEEKRPEVYYEDPQLHMDGKLCIEYVEDLEVTNFSVKSSDGTLLVTLNDFKLDLAEIFSSVERTDLWNIYRLLKDELGIRDVELSPFHILTKKGEYHTCEDPAKALALILEHTRDNIALAVRGYKVEFVDGEPVYSP